MHGIIFQKAIMDFLNVSGGMICMGKMIWGHCTLCDAAQSCNSKCGQKK